MRPQDPSQLGICSWCIPADNARDLADRVAALGLRKLQIDLTPIHQHPDAWADTADAMSERGVKIVSGMWGVVEGADSDGHWTQNLQLTVEAARVAQQLGVELVSTHVGRIPEHVDAPTYDKWVERVTRIASVLHDHGCRLLFETGQESAAGLRRFIDALDAAGCPRVAVNFDPANMLIHNTDDPMPAMETLIDRIAQCHLKDARRAGSDETHGVETPVGDGDVDWNRFLRILALADFTGDLIFERECGDNRADDLKRGVERVTTLMREQG